MNRRVRIMGVGLALLLMGMSVASSHKGTASNGKSSLVQASKLTQAYVKESVGKLPLAFEQNQGQTDPQVKYVARAKGYTAFLTENETVLSIKGSAQGVLRMKMQNARPASRIEPGDKQIGKTNYVRPQGNITGIPNYGKVTYKGIYPGIDVAYRGNQRDLEYDFVVNPGADPSQIRVAYEGSSRFALDGDGNLELETAAGRTLAHKPVVYQTIRGVRKPVQGDYVLMADNQVGFKLGAYDHSQTLVIDPVLNVLAFLAGVAPSAGVDEGFAVATNPSGTPIGVFLTGRTQSLTFITATLPAPKVAHSTAPAGNYDAYVVGLDPTGMTLVYTTFLGAAGDDNGEGIVVDNTGVAYVTGYTNLNMSSTAPVVAFSGVYNAFLAKFSAAGALSAITYFGGPVNTTQAFSIAQDTSGTATNGNLVIGGLTNGLAGTPSGEFKTFGGGTTDGFIATFNTSLALQASTYLGGSNYDQVNSVAVDFAGNIYAAGITASGDCWGGPNGQPYLPPNFPTGSTLGLNALGQPDVADWATNPAVPPIIGPCSISSGTQTAFATKFTANLGQRRYSSIFGPGGEAANGITVDATGVAYVVGTTRSPFFYPPYNGYVNPGGGFAYYLGGSLPPTTLKFGAPIHGGIDGFGNLTQLSPTTTQGFVVALRAPNSLGQNQGQLQYLALQTEGTLDPLVSGFCNLTLPRFGGALGGVPSPCIGPTAPFARIESWNNVTVDTDGQPYIAGQRVWPGPNSDVPPDALPTYGAEILRIRNYGLAPNPIYERLYNTGVDTQAFGIAVTPFRLAFFTGDVMGPAATAATVAGLGSSLAPLGQSGINNTTPAIIAGSKAKADGTTDALYGAIQFLDVIASPTTVTVPPVGLLTPTGAGGPTVTVALTDSLGIANTCVGGSISGPGFPFTMTQLANTNSFQVQLAGNATNTAQFLGPNYAYISCPGYDNVVTITISGSVFGPLDVAPAAILTPLTSVLNSGLISPYTTTANPYNNNNPYQTAANQMVAVPVSVITPGTGTQPYLVNIAPLGTNFPNCNLLGVQSNASGSIFANLNVTTPNINGTAQPVGTNPTYGNGGLFNVLVNSACAAGLPVGTYSANINVTNSLGGSAVTLPFSLQITSGGVVSQYPLSLGFLDKGSPAQQTSFSVNAQGSSPLSYGIYYQPATPPANPLPTANVSIVSGGLGTVPAGGTGSVIVQVTPTGLAAGIYMGTFYVTLPGTNPLIVPCPTAGVTTTTGCIGMVSITVFVAANGVTSLEAMIPPTPTAVSITAPAGYPASFITQPGVPFGAPIQISAVGNTQVTPLFVGNTSGVPGITAPTISTPANFPAGMTACFLPPGAAVSSTTQQPPCELRLTPLQGGNTCQVYATSPQYPNWNQCNYALSVDTTLLSPGTYASTVTFTTTTGLTLGVPISLTVTQFPSIVLTQNTGPQAGLPVTALNFTGVAGQNVTTCQSFNVNTTGGTIPGVTMSTTNSFLGMFITLPPANFQFVPGYFNSVSLGNLTNPGQTVWVCANAVGQPTKSTVLAGTVTFSGSGVGNPVLLPVSYTLSGGAGNPANLIQLGVFRPPATVLNPAGTVLGTFALDLSGTYNYAGATTKNRYFGLNGDQPVAGDFFGTGVVEYGVFRGGNWYIDANNNGVYDGIAGGDMIWSFGLPNSATTTDQAIVGDWTGDGKSKIGIMRCPVTMGQCTWYLDAGNKHAYDPATVVTINFGLTGDIPVTNNWNHTGTTDQIGVYHCTGLSVCQWLVDSNGNGTTGATYNYGWPTDRPMVGNWYGTGTKRIGVFRTVNGYGQPILNLSGTNVYQQGIDFNGNFGLPGDLPVIGLWTQFP
ncbi:MAG: SBBP repeat-containing protein [Bryobacteraceae bacterium]